MPRAGTGEFPDARLTLQAYAVAIGLGGFMVAGWGPLWLGAHLAELPFGRAALIRMCGAVMMASALVALGLARADIDTRKRLLSWFIAAHVVVWAILQLQLIAIPGDVDVARAAAWVMLAVILGLLYVRFPGNLPARQPVSVVDVPDGAERHSASRPLHERQIRDAAAQEERNRLARDLHDAVKQQIFAIQTSAATAEARFETDAPGARAAVAQVRQSAREAMAEMEAMLEQLRVAPLGHTGLVEAIRKQCDALAFRTGAHVDVRIGQLPDEDTLGPGAHEAIYRIVQEALANVGRHARARHVQVSLDATSAGLDVTVQDDGQGFEPTATSGGMGLHNMRTRASEIGGSIDVRSTADTGTLVTLSVPFETADVRRYRRNQALVLAGVLGIGIVALLIDLFENGPGLGNATLVVFVLLFARHARTVLQPRTRDRSGVATRSESQR